MSMPSMVTTGRSALRSTWFAHHLRLGRALGARRPDVVLTEGVHHVGADHPDVDRGEEERERHPRQYEMVRPLCRTTARGRLLRVDEVAIAALGNHPSRYRSSTGARARSRRRAGRFRAARRRSRLYPSANSAAGPTGCRWVMQSASTGWRLRTPGKRYRGCVENRLRDVATVVKDVPSERSMTSRCRNSRTDRDRLVETEPVRSIGQCTLPSRAGRRRAGPGSRG